MRKSFEHSSLVRVALLVGCLAFLYAPVLQKLGIDWWTDKNYSHGLLVPFVIGFVVWSEWETVKRTALRGSRLFGGALISMAILLLAAGTLAAELFTTRVSLVLMVAGVIVYLFGLRLINVLAVPFALFALAIPIPQIVFNRIAFPLQIWASQMAVWGIRLFDVPTLRKGNVIDILPNGGTQTISLEVVEACSGIRSLMTLVTLALILSYFTRRADTLWCANMSKTDLARTVVLMLAAVPIAVLTNAARVTGTGILTFHYGKSAAEGAWHDATGWLVYGAALGLLIALNFLLRKVTGGRANAFDRELDRVGRPASDFPSVLPLIAAILVSGITINWMANRGEAAPGRRPLAEFSATLGDWRQKGAEIRFGEQTESVLRTTDYTMREYLAPDGRIANVYIGYYGSQRSGATYHSPQNCLPGSGWVMRDPAFVDIPLKDGKSFKANSYVVENGPYREVMVYWYQGRGRTEASEYTDKINTITDSVIRRRTDGAMVRVMTGIAGSDESGALTAATDLAAYLAQQLSPFVPE